MIYIKIENNEIAQTSIEASEGFESYEGLNENDIMVNPSKYEFKYNKWVIKMEAIVSISMRQARLILYRYNLLDTINNVVNSLGEEAKLTWEYSSVVEVNNPLVNTVCLQAGMTEEQIETMFREANEI